MKSRKFSGDIFRTAAVGLMLVLLGGCTNFAHQSTVKARQSFYDSPPRTAPSCNQNSDRPLAAEHLTNHQAHAGYDTVATTVSLSLSGGTFVVSGTINNTIEVPFIVDSGASDVSIPANYVELLMRTGSICIGDFLGKRVFRLSNGATVPTQTFRLKSVRVGERVIRDVTGSVAIGSGRFLLGQSFLGRFRSWSIDNERKVLILD